MNDSQTLPAGESSFERIRTRHRRSSTRWFWLALITFLLLLVAGSVYSGVYFFIWQRDATTQVVERYEHHPLIVERLGGIDRCSFSVLETTSPDSPEDDVLAFRVTGPRKSGFIYIKSLSGEPRDAEWAGLRIGDEFWRLEHAD